jgi:MFS family permease
MGRLLVLALAGGALCSVPLAFVGSWPEVLGLRIVLGLLAGGSTSLAYTLGARLAPAERSGLTLSVLASSGQFGGAISPILAGVLAQLSLQSVFIANSMAYLVALVLAALPTRGGDRAAGPEAGSPHRP